MAAQTVDAFNEAIIDCMPEIKRVPYIKGILARMTAVGVAPDLTTCDPHPHPKTALNLSHPLTLSLTLSHTLSFCLELALAVYA